MRSVPRYLSGKSSWRTERPIAVALDDLPEVTKHTVKWHTATGCPKGTFQVVVIPSLDVRKRSPLARRPRSRYAFPLCRRAAPQSNFSGPTTLGQGLQVQTLKPATGHGHRSVEISAAAIIT